MKAEKQKQSDADGFLSLCTVDMTAKTYDQVIGRDKEIENIIEILCRKNKANPILVGEAGVGKTAVIQGLVNRIKQGNIPQKLMNKRIRSLDLSLLSKNLDAIKFTLDEIIKSGDILFIDEIHNIVGAGRNSGSLDVANIMKPLLTDGSVSCIGATTLDEYQMYFEKDSALERRFSKVLVEEPTVQDATLILMGLKDKYEKHHEVTISNDAISSAVTYSARYITDRRLPDKAFDVLDEACSRKSLENSKLNAVMAQSKEAEAKGDWETVSRIKYSVLPELLEKTLVVKVSDILEVISHKTGIPVNSMTQSEREKLLNLENKLHERVVGQGQALKVLADSIRNTRVGLSNNTTSILFLGTTGVGKTEAAKALAEVLFNSEDALIRLDMSEYKESQAISKLIGSPAGYVGYDDGGQLTEAVKRKPYSVILLDEVEKAHKDIWDVFLQVFDDGRLTDNKGRTVDFKNTIIIMTSNLKEENLGDFFKAEFLNRISSVVTFKPLEKDSLEEIVIKQVSILSEKLKDAKGIELGIGSDLVDFLVEKAYESREFGARPIKRFIKDNLETLISKKILENDLKNSALILKLSDIREAA